MNCDHCGEEIDPAHKANITGQNLHGECAVRLVIGSVGHLMKVCHCFVPGSTISDPPFVTKRQAAILANALWRFQHEFKTQEHKACEKIFNRHLHPPGQ